MLVGNLLDGIVALRYVLPIAEQIAALGLVDTAGLGHSLNPFLPRLSLSGYGKAAIAWCKTSLVGAKSRATLLFTHPHTNWV